MSSIPRRTDHGQATIEMIGIIPLAALIGGAIIQLYLVGYAAVAAESAARLAAREASDGTSTAQAGAIAEADVNPIFRPVVGVGTSDPGEEPSVSVAPADSVTMQATLTVPFLGIGVKGLDYQVTRYTVMPITDD